MLAASTSLPSTSSSPRSHPEVAELTSIESARCDESGGGSQASGGRGLGSPHWDLYPTLYAFYRSVLQKKKPAAGCGIPRGKFQSRPPRATSSADAELRYRLTRRRARAGARHRTAVELLAPPPTAVPGLRRLPPWSC